MSRRTLVKQASGISVTRAFRAISCKWI
jgi:hypothetical protein